MLFTSLDYFVLLLVSAALYWLTPSLRIRQIVLLISSVIFYASWMPPFLLLLLLVMAINFFAGLHVRTARHWLVAAVVIDLMVLAIFKYTNFAISSGVELLNLLGLNISAPHFNIVLPLGISFYIFQAIAYVVDVRTKRIEAERDPLVFLLFKLFFPQLIAGPITRGHELLPQLKTVHRFHLATFAAGLLLLSCGLVLKSGLADNISPYVNLVFADPAKSTGASAALGAVGFGAVILGDFWGYSTMALGSALLFGVVLPPNFNLPYIATSLQSFWRRWHMTLSTWLRDYLYIPLGGSRGGSLMTARNLMIVMGLGGLWHGAAWTFVIWGLIHGSWLVIERTWLSATRGFKTANPQLWRLTIPAGWVITMIVVFTGWVFFRAATPQDAITILGRIATFAPAQMDGAAIRIALIIGVFFAAMYPLHLLISRRADRLLGITGMFVISFWLTLLAVVLSAEDLQSFIYFQF